MPATTVTVPPSGRVYEKCVEHSRQTLNDTVFSDSGGLSRSAGATLGVGGAGLCEIVGEALFVGIPGKDGVLFKGILRGIVASLGY
jgi:hypothetical protein